MKTQKNTEECISSSSSENLQFFEVRCLEIWMRRLLPFTQCSSRQEYAKPFPLDMFHITATSPVQFQKKN